VGFSSAREVEFSIRVGGLDEGTRAPIASGTGGTVPCAVDGKVIIKEVVVAIHANHRKDDAHDGTRELKVIELSEFGFDDVGGRGEVAHEGADVGRGQGGWGVPVVGAGSSVDSNDRA